jgi:transaldolase
MPRATLEAFADHGVLTGESITTTYTAAQDHLDALWRIGVDFDNVTETLEREGLSKFEKSWDELGRTVSHELRTTTS